jgi:hypothetical protein
MPRIHFNEVVTRDGFQNEPAIVGRDVPGQVAKAGLITDLHPTPAYVAELRSHFS